MISKMACPSSFFATASVWSLLTLLIFGGCQKPQAASIPAITLPPGTPFLLEQPPVPAPSASGEPYVGVLSGIATSGGALVVSGYQGTLLRRKGSGGPWVRLDVPGGRDLYGVVQAPGGTLWAYGDRGILLRSSDRGAHWSTVTLPSAPRFLSAASFPDARTGFIAGASGALYRTTDGGDHWAPVSLPTKKNLYAVVFLDPMHGLVAGWHQTLLRTSDGGSSWQPVEISIQKVTRQKPSYNAFWFDGHRLLLAGDHGLLFSSDDGGGKFVSIETGTLRDLYGVCQTAAGRVAVAGEAGTFLLMTPRAGGQWTVSSPLGAFHAADFLGISCGSTHVRLVGSKNAVVLPSNQ